jgi:mono/diheme cytochrome c family protein
MMSSPRSAKCRTVAMVAAMLALASLGGHAARQGEPQAPGPKPEPASDAVTRGEYLVKGVGCADCHTPHVMGPRGPEANDKLLLSGHPAGLALPPPPAPSGPWIASASAGMTAWAGPWGVSYTANLTPDESGLGSWTEQQFVDTMRSGRHQGRGRTLLPPMPWQAFANFSDDDLKAMFAYLRSIPPVKNKVPDPIVAGPPAKK